MIKEDGGKMEEQQKTAKMIREVVNLSQEVKVDDIHPWTAQSQAGQWPEQPGVVEGAPAHGWGWNEMVGPFQVKPFWDSGILPWEKNPEYEVFPAASVCKEINK